MSFLWFLVIGLFVGFIFGVTSKNADIGKFGNVLIGILGALTAGYFFNSLGMSAKFNMFWNFIIAATGSLFFLYLMRKLLKAF